MTRRFLPALLLLFIGSGCAALIYEIVWFQLLQLVIGLTTVSLGILLGTFMGGMCLGSLLLPRCISPRRHLLRVYALLELGIGVCGVAILFLVPWVAQLYTQVAGGGLLGLLLRGLRADRGENTPFARGGSRLSDNPKDIFLSPSGGGEDEGEGEFKLPPASVRYGWHRVFGTQVSGGGVRRGCSKSGRTQTEVGYGIEQHRYRRRCR